MGAAEERERSGPQADGREPPAAYAEAIAPFRAELAELGPDGAELCDVHTHLGHDEDGQALDLPALLAQLDDAGVSRGCVFPLHDPDRRPAYRVPNDRVLAWAEESGGRLSAFCRLDPLEDPVAEGERCLGRGAEGVKLHPRAQAFAFDAPEMDAIFRLASEARVPLLIHMGRGMPPVADGLVALAERHPDIRLVLAHAAIADQGVITARLRDHPGVLYDTSCWSMADLLGLLGRVPLERICFGSDPPYGRPLTGLYFCLRAVRAVGGTDEDVALVGGGTAAALVARGDLPPATPPRPERAPPLAGALQRVHAYGMQAFGSLFPDRPDAAAEMLDLAVAATRDPASDTAEEAETLERLAPALSATADLLREPGNAAYGMRLLHVSLALAATSG